ncbi:hypothetical protein VNI00_012829 [Paramarasmius palmivorus]|uniref:Uncharacterized protein n=1 Tax=Paramarasmius palmivorus TaxID=297713 RepID=A0AAW0C380_9AGAR
MSSPHYIEQDRDLGNGADELPTYDDLAAQAGPNSRFGRWREWIEKRAAERYNDITPEERLRRRERGWGNEGVYEAEGSSASVSNGSVPVILNQPPTPGATTLTIKTSHLSLSDATSLSVQSQTLYEPSAAPLPPLPSVSNKLRPTHLKMHTFGSRFLPHTKSQIRCILPLPGDRMLLIGHDDGLSVLDMFPREWTEAGHISMKGPEEAQALPIWQGESVFQMSVLELEETTEGSPHGVILALVGPEPETPSGKDSESLRTLRMYNLASLTSLAKWAISQKGARPLDLRRPSNWNAQQTPTKKHRPQSSITKGLKSLIDPNHLPDAQSSSYQALLSPSSTNDGRRSPAPLRQNSEESSWDVVDDLPLRWATDFVPLATSGSRLSSLSVISYALWSSDGRTTSRGGRMLAIATKSNILLYETPKGERAFRFLKEFYTPLPPRNITFFHQAVSDVSRSLSDAGPRFHHSSHHRRAESISTVRETRASVASGSTLSAAYGPQLSLFVIFDKRSGWIRLADSAVGELELYDDHSMHARESTSPTSHRKSRISASFDGPSHSGKWLPPTTFDLPVQTANGQTKRIMILTRGKRTHILPSPLPVGLSPCPPYLIITWKNTPTTVTPRVCEPPDDSSAPPYLQIIALGEMGVEVQERSFAFLGGKGKGKMRADDVMHIEEDTGGDSGFLAVGGHWDRPQFAMQAARYNAGLSRSYSTDSYSSGYSSLESEELANRLDREQGLYCWCRKGLEDWRVFWLGGVHEVSYGEEE